MKETPEEPVILSYSYRLCPSKQQHRALERILEAQRQLYNAALQERIDAYRKASITLTYIDQTKELTEWRRSDSEAASIPLSLQRATLARLEEAYRAFFRRAAKREMAGFPRFRGKGWFDSFGFREFSGITLKGHRLRFKGMPGAMKVHFHRPLPTDDIRSCVFKRRARGWIVCFAVSVECDDPRRPKRTVGIDLGLNVFATLSDGTAMPSARTARRHERQLRLAQRSLARKKRGSNGRKKARAALRKCYQSIARRRSSFLHQASARIARRYDLIAVERLNIRGLVGSLHGKAVSDAGWALFLSMLRYKAERAGARVVEVDPAGTTQECSRCTNLVPKHLGERTHRCDRCGLVMDRDLNAAKNILNRAGVGPSLQNVAESACVQA